MSTYTCTDGFVEKMIAASSPEDAADAYALVTCDVDVTDEAGHTVVIAVNRE